MVGSVWSIHQADMDAERQRQRREWQRQDDVLEQQAKLDSLYADSLAQVISDQENPIPSFQVRNPYRYETLSDSEKLTYQLQMCSDHAANIDFVRRDLQNLKSSASLSTISSWIFYTQKTQQNLWQWMAHHSELIFYRRAEYLFRWYQFKYFKDQEIVLLDRWLGLFENKIDKHKYTQKIAGIKEYTSVYKEFIKECSNSQGILQIDRFVEAMQSDDYQKLTTLYDYLDRARLYYLARHKPGEFSSENLESQRLSVFCLAVSWRKIAAPDANELMEIMRTQLKILPKNMLDEARSTVKKLAAQVIAQINHDSLPADALPALTYPAALGTLYENSLWPAHQQFHNKFMLWLKGNVLAGADIAEIHDDLKTKLIDPKFEDCKKSVLDQKRYDHQYSRAISGWYEPIILPVHSYSAMHLVMREYACLAPGNDKDLAFNRIEMLITRGYSPYTKDKDSYTAMGYADACAWKNDWMEWRLFSCILSNMITRSPYSEKLRAELLIYCENSIKEVKTYYWYFTHNPVKESQRLLEVEALSASLNEAAHTFCDENLLPKVSQISRETQSLELQTLLVNIKKSLVEEGCIYLRKPKYSLHLPKKGVNTLFSQITPGSPSEEVKPLRRHSF